METKLMSTDVQFCMGYELSMKWQYFSYLKGLKMSTNQKTLNWTKAFLRFVNKGEK